MGPAGPSGIDGFDQVKACILGKDGKSGNLILRPCESGEGKDVIILIKYI
jgi:hypothetical protein